MFEYLFCVKHMWYFHVKWHPPPSLWLNVVMCCLVCLIFYHFFHMILGAKGMSGKQSFSFSSGHNHWGRATIRWQPQDHSLWHWHDQVHLLRLLSGGLPCGCNCWGEFSLQQRMVEKVGWFHRVAWSEECKSACKGYACLHERNVSFLDENIISIPHSMAANRAKLPTIKCSFAEHTACITRHRISAAVGKQSSGIVSC